MSAEAALHLLITPFYAAVSKAAPHFCAASVLTSFTDQTSGCMTSWSGGALRIRRSRHSAAFLRTMGRVAPLLCKTNALVLMAGFKCRST